MLSSIPRRTGTKSPWVCAQCRRRTTLSGLPHTLTILPTTSASTSPFAATPPNTRSVSSNNLKRLAEETAHLQQQKIAAIQAARDANRRTEDEGNTASIVSKLLAGAAGKSTLYPPGQPPIPPVNKLPTKWNTNPFLRPVIRETIRKVYPHIEDLTPIQAKLLAALAKRMHLSVADIPGTGKSFAMATWMLNLDRSTRTTTGMVEPTSTVLTLVPNSDLALQYYSWITNILQNSGSEAVQSNVSNFVQVVYRTGDPAEDDKQKQLLRDSPNPHIIIGTPNRILDILADGVNSQKKLLDIDHLKLVVIDEADSLLDFEAIRGGGGGAKKKAHAAKVPPTEQLLDYIFQNRNKKLVTPTKAKGELNYIQLVSTSSSTSARSMRRWIEIEKGLWLSPFGKPTNVPGSTAAGEGVRLGFAPNLSPVKPGELVSPFMATLQREDNTFGTILRKIHEGIKHHIVAYDIETGFLRDAPFTRMEMKDALTKYIQSNMDSQTQTRHLRDSPEARKEREAKALAEEKASKEGERKLLGDDGYPETISVPILEKLLKSDNWPENVIVGLGSGASKSKFMLECERIGIHAEVLSFESWNSRHVGEPLGRTDQHLASKALQQQQQMNDGRNTWKPADRRSNTTVWITDPVACAGLDSPGITHAYLFHRLETTKDYIAYCGRVSRHPFPEQQQPHSLLRDTEVTKKGGVDATVYGMPGKIKTQPPVIGKVVSVILEEQITPEEARLERISEAQWAEVDRAAGRSVGVPSYKVDERMGSGYRFGKGEKVVRVPVRPAPGEKEKEKKKKKEVKGGKGGKGKDKDKTSRVEEEEVMEVGVPVVQIGSMFEKDAFLNEGVRREKIGCVIEKYFAPGMEDRGMVLDGEDDYDAAEDAALAAWGVDDQDGVDEDEEDDEDYEGEVDEEEARLQRRRKWAMSSGDSMLGGLPDMPLPKDIPAAPAPVKQETAPVEEEAVEEHEENSEVDENSEEVDENSEDVHVEKDDAAAVGESTLVDAAEPVSASEQPFPATTEPPESAQPTETKEPTTTDEPKPFQPTIKPLPTPLPSSQTAPIPPPTALDPTLTPEELAEYHQAQLEIVGAYDELAQLMGQVWDNTPKEVKAVVEGEMEKEVGRLRGVLHESGVVVGEGVEGLLGAGGLGEAPVQGVKVLTPEQVKEALAKGGEEAGEEVFGVFGDEAEGEGRAAEVEGGAKDQPNDGGEKKQ